MTGHGTGPAFWRWLLLIWIVGAAAMIGLAHDAIAGFRFPDPDDVMRLVEVRDWLGGQAWFDVGQHRMNPPWGLSMHWSRLVDLPIAAVITLSRPFVGQRMAETIAAVAVPMLSLGGVMALAAALTRRLVSPSFALLAAAACPTSVAIWFALRPMRIDHHGWQIAAGLGIAVALTARPTRRNAAIAGLCAAVWTDISLEGLPFGAAAAAWLGLLAILGGRAEIDRLTAYLASFTLVAAGLLLAIRGPEAFAGLACDAMSTVHIAALGWATLASLIAARASRRWRIPILIGAAVADAAFFRAGSGPCLSGPFAQLGPLGYSLWYRGVNEGMPLWRLAPELVLLWGWLPIVGLTGAVLGWGGTTDRAARAAASTYVVLLCAASAIGLVVMRAGAFANVLALPGAMMAIAALARASRGWAMPARVIARTLSVIAFTPLGAAIASGIVIQQPAGPAPRPLPPSAAPCGRIDDFATLDALPATVAIAPIDAGPALIAGSHHRTITGPYHRDPQALEDVLRFFSTNPGTARAIARSRGASLLVLCPADHDLAILAARTPHGLASPAVRDTMPWLKRLHLPHEGGLVVYRIKPSQG